LSKLNALISLMLATLTATASEDSIKPPTSRQVNQEALSCTHPGNCVNSFSSYGLEALAFERIDYRSRSKLGLYDFNKNRSRMQDFTASFKTVTVNAKKDGKN
jgi:uncharacterized protein (DUF1499 family)